MSWSYDRAMSLAGELVEAIEACRRAEAGLQSDDPSSSLSPSLALQQWPCDFVFPDILEVMAGAGPGAPSLGPHVPFTPPPFDDTLFAPQATTVSPPPLLYPSDAPSLFFPPVPGTSEASIPPTPFVTSPAPSASAQMTPFDAPWTWLAQMPSPALGGESGAWETQPMGVPLETHSNEEGDAMGGTQTMAEWIG